MKIIFVTDQLQNGGAEREIVAFANTFVELGQEVHIFCIKEFISDYSIDQRVCRHRLSLTSRVNIPKVRVLFRWRNAIPELRDLHADVMLSFNLSPKYFLGLWFAVLFTGTKLLYVVRNNLEKKYSKRKDRRRRRYAARLADGIWIQTEEQRFLFSKHQQKKVFIVPNIIDPRFLQIPEHKREAIYRFVNVGRLHPQKNQKLLIEAFAEMIKRTEDQHARLFIYGQTMPWDYPIDAELRQLIQKYRLEERVFLPGRSKEIEKIYEEADAFVFSSDYEGLPNALMEAMAAGLPCISTNCPTGPSTLIKSGENGLLVPVRDVDAMARAMEYFITHPQQAQQMGTAARKRMESWESREELAEKLLENLRRICK